MTKPVVGVLALALVVGGLAFAIGKATVSDAESPSQEAQGTETLSPAKAPALASTGAVPALRTPKPTAAPSPDSSSDSSSSPSIPAPPSGTGTPDTGGSGGGGGGGGSGGTTNETPGAGEF
jgi:hypothetical protein